MLNVITVFRNDVFAGCRCADEMHRSTALYVHQEAAVCHRSVMYLLLIYWHSHHYYFFPLSASLKSLSEIFLIGRMFSLTCLVLAELEDHMAQMILSFLLPAFSLLLLP